MANWDWEQVRNTIVWTTITLCATALLVTCIHECQQTERVKFEHGYVQSFVPTTVGPVWTKPTQETP
jgi:hypothetical protein